MTLFNSNIYLLILDILLTLPFLFKIFDDSQINVIPNYNDWRVKKNLLTFTIALINYSHFIFK